MNIEKHKNKLKNVCDQLEKKLNEDSYPKKEDDVVALIQVFYDALYGDAVGTFVKTIKGNRNVFSNTEYNQIKPLFNKWKNNKWKFWKTQHIGPESFNDFKNDLNRFSQQYPDFFTENGRPISTLDFFLQNIWEPIFKEYEQRINLLVSRLSINLESKGNKYKVFIDTEYELMQPFEFERFIAKLFNKMGYSAKVTSKTGDFGIDVIAKKGEDVVAIQAKKYSVGNNIGNRAVQRLIGSMSYKDYKANKGILITTSDFTNQAYNQAEGNPVELWNQDYLNKMVEKYFKINSSQ
ncbi:MAG TPA: restriction endonuclease [Balneolaceae bacterium]|nr:restriction endonuclease [Balneolaceae bacterium]